MGMSCILEGVFSERISVSEFDSITSSLTWERLKLSALHCKGGGDLEATVGAYLVPSYIWISGGCFILYYVT